MKMCALDLAAYLLSFVVGSVRRKNERKKEKLSFQ